MLKRQSKFVKNLAGQVLRRKKNPSEQIFVECKKKKKKSMAAIFYIYRLTRCDTVNFAYLKTTQITSKSMI